MLHEDSDHDEIHHQEEHAMGDDFDLDDAVLWGDDDDDVGVASDDSGEDNEMESDEEEEGEDDEPEIPPQLAFNADGRPVLWNLGQLGALCVSSRCLVLVVSRLNRAQLDLAAVNSVVSGCGLARLCFLWFDAIEIMDGVIRGAKLGLETPTVYSQSNA